MEQEISLKIMDYLKKFKNHSEYEANKNSLLNPNVSYCANQADVHYKVKDYRNEYLTFEALEDGTFSLDIGSAVSTSVLSNISYSIDSGETWVLTNNVDSTAVTITTPTVTAGNTVMWKGNGTGVSTTINNNDRPSTSSIFSSTGTFNAQGNILSLIYGDDFAEEDSVTGTYNFACLFYSYNTTKTAKIVSCEKMAMPIKNVPDFCYLRVFQGCTTLETPMRIIDAESMGNSTCMSMFIKCTSLTVAPELPATTLANGCYSNMFNACTSLTVAPELPATTLANSCYYYMFTTCTSLSIAPELPATTLAEQCYDNMFRGCTNLTVAPELPATTLGYQCYRSMFYDCTSLTVAPELPATTLATNCYVYMFRGCTKLTVAPELPATTLANSCYYGMFHGCTSLTVAPELHATTLALSSYTAMFYGSTSLTAPPELPATTLASQCYQAMFYGCRSLTVAPDLPATTLASRCYDGMFWECSNLKILPELPATTLASYCYWGTFRGTAVEESPILSAETLVEGCYNHLFMECPNLKKVTCLATNISANECLTDWITEVGEDGTFVKAPSMTSWPSGTSGIPNGWTVKDAT